MGNTNFAQAVGHKVLGRPELGANARDALSTPQIRHTTIKIDGNTMTVFYSRAGDLPEALMCSQVDLTGDWRKWRLSVPVPVLEPTMDYEGGNMAPRAPTNQEMQVLPRPMFRELRDPCIFREEGKTYLFYSVAGERGIAGAELKD